MAVFAVDDLDATPAQVAGLGGERVMIHEDSDDEAAVRLDRPAIREDDQEILLRAP